MAVKVPAGVKSREKEVSSKGDNSVKRQEKRDAEAAE